MKKILLIDDDRLLAQIFTQRFAAEGWQLESAATGEEGLARIESSSPDLLVLDQMLPDMLGLDLLGRLRKNSRFQALPVVILSNSYMQGLSEEFKSLKPSAILSKSATPPSEILSTLRTLLVPSTAQKEKTPSPSDPARDQFRLQLSGSKTQLISDLESTLKQYQIQPAEASHQRPLIKLIHHLAGGGGMAGYHHVSQLASAIEVLIAETGTNKDLVSPSVVQSISHGVDTLRMLLQYTTASLHNNKGLVLIVDDDPISRKAISRSVDRSGLHSLFCEDPSVAYGILKLNTFDLITMDIDMPGFSGLDLCKHIRSMPHSLRTPVIFVTALSHFESNSQYKASGGTDMIAKPFLTIELAVKILSLSLRNQFQEPV